MGAKYLIDTNVVIDFSDNVLPQNGKSFVASIIDNEPFLSIINKIELLGFSEVSNDIVELVETATVIGLTDAIIHKTIAIRKSRRIKLSDAIIAATAVEHHLHLVTRNVTDFQNIRGLKIINPWEK